ncbi:hypothetical protein McpSp1_15780 [Methanocorpusculaceae archaeon Sp1]|nr:hypothetical protein [Methanocorpusculaceae archaeon Sp1]
MTNTMQTSSPEPACLVCGAPLHYRDTAEEMTCSVCGRKFSSNARCENGHFVCDACHASPAISAIRSICLETQSKNPFTVATAMMHSPSVHMHGPEHHILVGAALLAAYRNAGGDVCLQTALDEMVRRGSMVPGGFCGLAGSCGAALSAGMFYSIATKTNPLSTASWSRANQLTAACLDAIGKAGGPRCCKRDSFLALGVTVPFVLQHLEIAMEMPDVLRCEFFSRNRECLKERCRYFPRENMR